MLLKNRFLGLSALARFTLSAAATTVLSTALCGTMAHAEVRKVVVAMAADAPTLDPSMYTTPAAWSARINVFDGLVAIGKGGALEPRLATEWSVSDGAKVWEFKIRKGVKFHNGEEMTIEDVAFSFEKIIADEKSPVRSYLNTVEKVETVGDDTIRFTLKAPFSTFDRNISPVMILPKKAYTEMGSGKFSVEPIGTGVYQVVRWVKDDRIELKAFDEHFTGAPFVKEAELRPIPSEPSRIAGILSGEIDIGTLLSPSALPMVQGKDGVKVVSGQGFKVMFLGFNADFPALKDVKLRKAIDMAIDRDAITKGLLRGTVHSTGQPLAPVVFGHDPNIAPTAFNLEEAKRLVAESSYDGSVIPMFYPKEFIPQADAVAAAIQGFLEKAGVKVELRGSDYNAFYSEWAKKNHQGMYFFTFGPLFLDGDSPANFLLTSRGNRSYIFNDAVDALHAQSRVETDPAKRAAIFSEMVKKSDEYKAYSYLYYEDQQVPMRADIEFEPTPEGAVRLWNVKIAD